MSNYNKLQLEAINGEEDKTIIIAPPGSGKTFTLVGAIQKYVKEHPSDAVTAITFTKKAAAELAFKLTDCRFVHTATIHSWSLLELRKLSSKHGFEVKVLKDDEIQEILQYLCRKNGYYTMNYILLTSFVMGNYNLDLKDGIKKKFMKIANEYIEYKKDNRLYDFTDLPQYLYDMLNLYGERITNVDALFVDEFQDVDPTQADIFDMVDANKHFYIGDPDQCQPAGTKVYVRGYGDKNIEDIKVGDIMVYYDSDQGYCSGNKLPHNAKKKIVTNTACRDFVNDYLITVTTEEGRVSSYTPNHRTYVRLNVLENKHVVYLMCDNNYRFRVGKIPLCRDKNSSFDGNPWRTKMKSEGCSRIWLLKYFDSDKEARVEEVKISYTYGIPQTCFQTNKTQWTEEDIDYIYEDIDIYERADKCLKDYKLNIKYPLLDLNIDWLQKNHYTTNSYVQIYCSNLMPEYMSCMAWGSGTSSKNNHPDRIMKVDKKFINEPIKVYSLEVEGGTYMADGLMTHNCIYMFRGAMSGVIDMLNDKGFKKRILDENYRSYQSIIDFSTAIRTSGVNKCVDITHLTGSWIKCVRKDQPGEVYTLKSRNECYDLIKQRAEDPEKLIHYFIEKKPFILCRSNKQVKKILELGYKNVSTVHQAKGLEYSDVVFTDCYLASEEEINIAYVACTRAENSLLVTSYDIFFEILATIISEEGKEIYQPKLF